MPGRTNEWELTWTEHGAARRIVFDRPLRLGRGAGNDIVLDDETVSRTHCVVTPGADRLRIDAGQSKNGVRVDGVPVARGECRDGHTFQVGRAIFSARRVEASASAPPGGQWWLEWNSPGGRQRRPLDRPLRIGRDPTNDIVLADANVSRQHAVVTLRDGQPHIDATMSGNGVRIGGTPFGKYAPAEGELFVAGGTTFRVMREEAAGGGLRVRRPAPGGLGRGPLAAIGGLAAAVLVGVAVLAVVLSRGGGGGTGTAKPNALAFRQGALFSLRHQ